MIAATQSRNRLSQTFKFLKELDQLRNPVSKDLSNLTVHRLDNWPVHPCILINRSEDELENDSNLDPSETKDEAQIRIRRAGLTICEPPPEILEGWLKPNWQIWGNEVDVLRSRNYSDEERQSVTVQFSDDPNRVSAFNEWKITRDKWIEAEEPAIEARKLFETIHALWTEFQRDGDRIELLLADGMLYIPELFVEYPILLQRVEIEFNPDIPEFSFNSGVSRAELNRPLLRMLPEIDGKLISNFDKELETTPIEPLGGDRTQGFFKRLIQGLFKDGELLEKKIKQINKPSIWREQILLVRPRTAGLSTMLERIVAHLEKEDTPTPVGLSRIVGVESEILISVEPGAEGSSNQIGPEPDILFSKPANEEQYQIASRLGQAQAVLVQGPPGTGKTHTIANLLGFLLSQGKTVLVTAHTTKALKVLREKVDPALQALCLSVLEGDAESQGQLSRSAQIIANRLSSSDSSKLRREASILRERRKNLQETATQLRHQLRRARFSEVEEVVFGGEGFSPIEVAKKIKENKEKDEWIPGPIEHGTQCPLSNDELNELYKYQGLLTTEDIHQLSREQPQIEKLVSSADFRLLANEQLEADSRAKKHQPRHWKLTSMVDVTSSHLGGLHQRIQSSISILDEEQVWFREILFAGWSGGDLLLSWEDLLQQIRNLALSAGTTHRIVQALGPELPSSLQIEDLTTTLQEMVAYLEQGGVFGFKTKITKRSWHQTIAICKVEGRQPKSLSEFKALLELAKLELNRKRLKLRWERTVGSLGGPSAESLGNTPERSAEGFSVEIRKRLSWRKDTWEPLIDELIKAGFKWHEWLAEFSPILGEHGELARIRLAGTQGLAEIVQSKMAVLRRKELTEALKSQRIYLSVFPQSDVATILLQSQDSWHIENYEKALCELARLDGLRDIHENRLTLLSLLSILAPNWAQAISLRTLGHGSTTPLGNISEAWKWRQWFQELELRASVSMADLQHQIDKIEDELRILAAKIIENETWAAQKERTDLKAQQALMGYVQTIRRIGKGTGKGAPALLVKARELLAASRKAVPVWIMPLSRVFESFDPREKKFDVVIIDEASQSDVTALAALYLGREHVVVGDKEQVTPDAIGQRLDEVQRLISTDLHGIPNSHLYDGQTSIYDLAETAFGGVVSLREHFRCVPEIIQFSNHLSYHNSIRPLREPLSAGIYPAIISQRVEGFRSGNEKTNIKEAEEIVSLVMACLNSPYYQLNENGNVTSYGIISLLGDDQALLIETMLRQRIAHNQYSKHQILCGNAAQFQGDERDVVFLSMVDGPSESGPLTLKDAGPKDLYKKRYNVAVSRARNQLWVVHSLDPEINLKPGDLRKRLINHARNPAALCQEMEESGNRTESVFEKLVVERLVATGYRIKTQWKVGAYRIDIVVEGEKSKLAIECDGDRWHTPENLHRDLERQAILERLGWIFVRIRGSVFFREPEAAMFPVLERLSQLGIEKLGNSSVNTIESDSESLEKIRAEAQKIRTDWEREKETKA